MQEVPYISDNEISAYGQGIHYIWTVTARVCYIWIVTQMVYVICV